MSLQCAAKIHKKTHLLHCGRLGYLYSLHVESDPLQEPEVVRDAGWV